MRTLLSILDTGRSSLLAHQAAISTASNNTANVNVEGYSKRDVQFRSIGSQSGVGIGAIRRRADVWLDRRLMLEQTRLGTHQSQAQGVSSVELQVSSTAGGLGKLVDNFFSALRSAGTSPGDSNTRAEILAAGQSLADGFNQVSEALQRERDHADTALAAATQDATDLASGIADLSGRIAKEEAAGGDAGDLRDQRDVLVGQLSEHVEIQTLTGPDGAFHVFLGNGLPLVTGDRSNRLVATPDASLGGMSRIDHISGSGVASNLTDVLRDGKLGGLLHLRDDVIADTQLRVDQLAFDLASSVNAVHSAGFGTDGVSGRNFFAAPGGVAGAARLLTLEAGLADNPHQIAAAGTAATAQGGNDNILLLAALADADIAAGGSRTAVEEFTALLATVGRESAARQSGIETADAALASVQAMKDSATAVSIDEELIDITRYERAYQAGARIISTVDRMFETILQL